MTKAVYCPHCGEWNGHPDGVLMREDGNGIANPEQFGFPEQFWFYCPACGSETPCERSRETALAAALQRFTPPQKPLTLEELEELEKPWPVWFEPLGSTPYPRIIKGVRQEGIMFDDDSGFYWGYNQYWRCWRDRPTEKERTTAKWEDSDNDE